MKNIFLFVALLLSVSFAFANNNVEPDILTVEAVEKNITFESSIKGKSDLMESKVSTENIVITLSSGEIWRCVRTCYVYSDGWVVCSPWECGILLDEVVIEM